LFSYSVFVRNCQTAQWAFELFSFSFSGLLNSLALASKLQLTLTNSGLLLFAPPFTLEDIFCLQNKCYAKGSR